MHSAELELLRLKNPHEAQNIMRFFKTDQGQYGYGDKFLGIKVPQIRAIAQKHRQSISINDLQQMLLSPYHEVRLCALLIMVYLYEKTPQKDDILSLYLKNTTHINNWDLVDLTAPKIIGAHFLETNASSLIIKLANSSHLWEQRIAIVSQLTPVKAGKIELALELAQKYLTHKHDLIHKATGWILREIGKTNRAALFFFLEKHAADMPRTTLRYAIEKLTSDERHYFMKKKR